MRFDLEQLRDSAGPVFSLERTVRFQDVDAAGIVFHPRILEYFHDTFCEFLAANGHPLDRVLREKRWGAPLRHAEADFFAPLRFGDRMAVEMVLANLAQSEVTVGHRIRRLGDGSVATVGQTVHVFVDSSAFRRIAVPDELRTAFVELGVGVGQ
jgi:1,4-dihydroxy-2-naphthoyl-CoA hydrolase